MDLVAGSGHTNEVCGIVPTADRVFTLGLDKSLKSFQPSTNEFEYVLDVSYLVPD